MDSATDPAQPHAIIVPFMAKGHTLPLLDLSIALSQRGLRVTIITTPANSQEVASRVKNSSNMDMISIHVIPFPEHEDLPHGIENTDQLTHKSQFLPFLKATLKLKQPFRRFLEEEEETIESAGSSSSLRRPSFVISDIFTGWAVSISHSFNIPGLIFHAMGVVPTMISRASFKHPDCITRCTKPEGEPIRLPGLSPPFTLARADFPELIDETCAVASLLSELQGDESCYWGVVMNSFVELEGDDYIRDLESLYPKGVKVWCVGPVSLYATASNNMGNQDGNNPHHLYMDWLEKNQEPHGGGRVIYVSFGTQAHMSDDQMDEIALGLEMAGTPFVWVVKSRTWRPPVGWEERIKGRGLVLREFWVEQRSILAHPAVGGFLSHCGWNSVLESLSMGVPLLALPLGAEQPLNAKLVIEVLGAGIGVDGWQHPSVDTQKYSGDVTAVGKEVIFEGVKELICGEKSRMVRDKAKEIGSMANKAVEENGSSSKLLDQMIKCLIDR